MMTQQLLSEDLNEQSALHRYRRDSDFDKEFREARDRMQITSVVVPIVMVLVFVVIVIIMCICIYKRRMAMGGQRTFFASSYTTRTGATSYPPAYPATTGYPPNTGYPATTGYPPNTGYPATTVYPSAPAFPQHLQVNQGVDYPPPPSYGECVGHVNTNGASVGFESSFHDSGSHKIDSSCHDTGSHGVDSSCHDTGSHGVDSSCHDTGSHGVDSSCQGGSSNDF